MTQINICFDAAVDVDVDVAIDVILFLYYVSSISDPTFKRPNI